MSALQIYLRSRYSAATTKAYQWAIDIYVSNTAQAAQAQYKDVMDYIGRLRQRYGKATTPRNHLCAIKAYYDYLCYSGQRKDHPARTIQLRDKHSRDIQLQDLFTAQELERLLERKEAFFKLYYRNRAMISLLIYQGLRPVELAAVKVADINLEQGSVYVKGGAKNNSRQLALKPAQVMLLHQYITETRPKLLKGNKSEYLLIGLTQKPMTRENITSHIKRSYKGCYGSRKVNVQTIRQSVIANLLKEGHDLRMVQSFAGHKSPSTTERYKQSDVEVLKAVIKYHPIQ